LGRYQPRRTSGQVWRPVRRVKGKMKKGVKVLSALGQQGYRVPGGRKDVSRAMDAVLGPKVQKTKGEKKT